MSTAYLIRAVVIHKDKFLSKRIHPDVKIMPARVHQNTAYVIGEFKQLHCFEGPDIHLNVRPMGNCPLFEGYGLHEEGLYELIALGHVFVIERNAILHSRKVNRTAAWAKKAPVIHRKHLQPRSSLCWTVSYHYKQFDSFRLNVDLLQRKGFKVNVTMTITPDNYKEADDMLSSIAAYKVGMTIQPAITEDYSWDDHKDVLNHFKERQKSIPFAINPIDRPLDKRLEPQAACSAGTNYFVLFPDGKVYRCLGGAAYRQQKTMGHISDFNPNMFEHPCEHGCVYSCDLDALRGKWDNAETHQATALR